MVKLDKESLNAARMILEHPLVMEIISDMETSAMNGAVNAKLTDTETPAAYLAEVRAIRNFRSKLSFIITEGEATLKRNKAVE
jgi:hypothetical protein